MKFKYTFFVALCALLCVSCEDENTSPDTPEAITFISEANEFATRTNQEGNQWLSGDRLGIYMLEKGTQTPVASSANILYTTETEGASATFTSTSPFTYPEDGTEVDFIGYYPYSAGISDLTYSISLANQSSGSAAHDLMYAVSSGYSESSTTQVPLKFTHQLAKVTFRFQDTDGHALSPSGLLIQGMHTTAGFDLATATLSNATTAADITPYQTSDGVFEAIVLPAAIEPEHAVEYTLNGESYNWYLTDTENISLHAIESGYQYMFTLTVNDEGPLTGRVEVENGSLAPWGNGGDTGEGTAGLTINYTLYPANEATGVHADTYLTLTFTGEAPEVGTVGSIRVYRADDDTLVDEIQMGDTHSKLENTSLLHSKMDVIWAGDAIKRYRTSNYHPVTVEGQTATIKLHFNKLDYNTTYYVLIDSRVIQHKDFLGIKKPSAWTFTTREKPEAPTDAAHTVTVGHDPAKADFRTIQAALHFLVNTVGKEDQKTVYIQNGIYEELIFLRDVNNVTIKGESREGVIIRYKNYDNLNGGVGGSAGNLPEIGGSVSYSGGRSVLLIETVNKLRFESLTIENTYGAGNQAEAIYANNDHNALMFINCTIKSCQDTLNLKGFCWFYNCLVAGDVDFIWGGPSAALFEKCEIRSVGNGYIVQARVAEGNKGFVFLNCDLTSTGENTSSMYLARTGGNETYDNVTFANCRIHEIYHTSGWRDIDPLIVSLENGYKMYNCTDLNGTRLAHDVFNHSELAYELSEEEFEAHFSSQNVILSAYERGDLNWFAE
ncbi:MAG: pectinesterase family protein [Bacteroides sp.]|nr:pectinesterase family protein [Bacteroides sp.]